MGYRPSTLPQTGVLVTINQEGILMRCAAAGTYSLGGRVQIERWVTAK
jgi:hypothetical protein